MVGFMPGSYTGVEGADKKGGVVVAVSGGVDSAVAALILQDAGFRVVGVTLKNFRYDGNEVPERGCCSADAMENARRICGQLGITHGFIKAEKWFADEVIDNFLTEYENARTPNPCIRCNANVRFISLVDYADRLGIQYIATGHYARIYQTAGGRPYLARARCAFKDQSYFLSALGEPATLGRVLFPLGELDKEEVRKLARDRALIPSEKTDSQDVCFLADGSLKTFLAARGTLSSGPIENTRGEVVGEHEGLSLYTVGQRRKLGIAMGEPQYVVKLDHSRNVLVVGGEEDLYERELTCQLCWMDDEAVGKGNGVTAQIRSRHKASPLSKIVFHGRSCHVVFANPQKAICPGQTIAFYRGDVVVGSGIIETTPA